MNSIVLRTCREIVQEDSKLAGEDAPQPLKAFRAAWAYVLLGDPGAGKSTTFRTECEELGSEAIYISARDFLTLDPENHPKWGECTLFIDGLDEVRAGFSDLRIPLDRIRSRIDELGSPRFRISCREADWLGENDRRNLETVSKDSKVRALRLEPLSEIDIVKILEAHPKIEDVQAFVSEAVERGIGPLLTNPQALKMLAEAVTGGREWPESRLQTFEMACRQMAQEHNEEHRYGEPNVSPDDLLEVCGYLCAVQLITGSYGFSINSYEADTKYFLISGCYAKFQDQIRSAFSTKLFEGDGRGRFSIIHRHIAEFLGARYLANHIKGGLLARRVISLLIGGDGAIVSQLRGLSGWLAAQSLEARHLLIHRDPIGVGLYGDIRDFSSGDKHHLLLSLNREVADLGNVAPFGPLASTEMEPVLREFLKDPDRNEDQQLVTYFVLRILREGSPLSGLAEVLLDIVYDHSYRPYINVSALYALFHYWAASPQRVKMLRRILNDVSNGQLVDPSNDLLGALLVEMYPEEIPASRIWDYLLEERRQGYIGSYYIFWARTLLLNSSADDVPQLLDGLSARLPGLRQRLDSHNLDNFLAVLLGIGLKKHGERLELSRLYNWLSAASFRGFQASRYSEESIRPVRDWLERHPHLQKAVYFDGLMRYKDANNFRLQATSVWQSLHGSMLPSDFGLWCLERATNLVDENPRVSKFLLERAVQYHQHGSKNKGLSKSILLERTRGHRALEEWLQILLDPPFNPDEAKHLLIKQRYEERDRKRRLEWIEYLKTNADALRENRADPTLMYHLGRMYFDTFIGSPYFIHNTAEVQHLTREKQISEILGEDNYLVEMVMSGLRGTICRRDVPDPEEIIRLTVDSRMHLLAYPFLAGMDEIERIDASQLERLSEGQMRTALAFHYCTVTGRVEEPIWFINWVNGHPKLVAETLVQCAIPALHKGMGNVSGLPELACSKKHARIARHASLPLLSAFPSRCTLNQLHDLDLLLWAALQSAERLSFDALIEKKLSLRSMNVAQRVHWLAAGFVHCPQRYREPLEEFAKSSQIRVKHLAAFFAEDNPLTHLANKLDASDLRMLIGLLGQCIGPAGTNSGARHSIGQSFQVSRLIERLASLHSDDAGIALQSLLSDESVASWHRQIELHLDAHRRIYRDASYRHPDVGQLHKTLCNRTPANAADLAALLLDKLYVLATRIHEGNTDDWRQYWNEDRFGRPQSPKHEDSCRDALLSDMREMLPQDIAAQPEGQYARDKRADIRFAYGDFNVPIEVKKSNHRSVWSALHEQLVGNYTRDPETSGYGIYLVLWFGHSYVQPPPYGQRPVSAEEMLSQLNETLSELQSRKVSVFVVDVSGV